VGKDVNYDAKIEYLQLYVNLEDFSDIYAYGDSDGDKSMLNIANFKFYKPFRN
jgi:phosphoserine phosphatase